HQHVRTLMNEILQVSVDSYDLIVCNYQLLLLAIQFPRKVNEQKNDCTECGHNKNSRKHFTPIRCPFLLPLSFAEGQSVFQITYVKKLFLDRREYIVVVSLVSVEPILIFLENNLMIPDICKKFVAFCITQGLDATFEFF